MPGRWYDPTQGRGLPPYRSAAYACRSRSATADADRRTAVGHKSTDVGDHALACPRTGLLARRAKVVERAWVRVAREAVGAEGQVVPQQWRAEDRRRLDLVIYGATPNGSVLCCDATLVSPLTRTGQPQPCAADVDGAALRTAERRKAATYPELQGAGPQKLVVLGSEVGGRFNSDAQRLVRDLVRLRSYRAPPALRAAAASGWTRRWWGMLSVAVQQAVASTAAVAAAAACHQRRGPSARPRTRPRRGRRAEPPAAATPGVAVACRPWAPVGPADRTGSGREQKGV